MQIAFTITPARELPHVRNYDACTSANKDGQHLGACPGLTARVSILADDGANITKKEDVALAHKKAAPLKGTFDDDGIWQFPAPKGANNKEFKEHLTRASVRPPCASVDRSWPLINVALEVLCRHFLQTRNMST